LPGAPTPRHEPRGLTGASARRWLALDNQKFALDQHAIVSVDRDGASPATGSCEISGYAREELLAGRTGCAGLHPTAFSPRWPITNAGGAARVCERHVSGCLG
jgi:hypothetical protein